MKWCEKCKKGNGDLNAKYCVTCGNELILKTKKNIASIFSVIFFVCFISVMTYTFLYDTTGFAIFGMIIFFGWSLVLSIVWAIGYIIGYIKDKGRNAVVSKKRTVWFIIHIIQLIILIVYIFCISNIINGLEMIPIKKQLNSLYDKNYKVVDSCSYKNAGGTNDRVALVELKNELNNILYYYDVRDKEFLNSYNGLKNGMNIKLDDYFNYYYNIYTDDGNEYYFGQNYYYLVYADKDSEYPFSDLLINIIIERAEYDFVQQEQLANIINDIYNDYLIDDNYKDLTVNIYFTDKIDDSKKDKYKLFLTSQIADLSPGCSEEFFEKYNDNFVYKAYYTDQFNKEYTDNAYNEVYTELDNIYKELVD